MNDPQASASTSPIPARPAKSTNWPMVLVLFLLLAAGGYCAYVYFVEGRTESIDELKTLRSFLKSLEANKDLAAEYADADGDLVADPPKDSDKLLDPAELAFSVVGDDPERAEKVWKDFLSHLATATGRKVSYYPEARTVQMQLEALREGKLHVTAFNTGSVSPAVNTAGFVPLFCPADAQGKFSYEMEIIVSAKHPAKTPADLKGQNILFTALSSTSGARAAIVALKDEFRLLPGRDYRYVVSGDHRFSIREVATGFNGAACVASDLLARAVAEGEIKPEQFRSIYKSQPMPPLCFGVGHNLKPDLAAKVKEAFQSFRFAKTSVEEAYKAQGSLQFAPVDYKLNWAYIRKLDESLVRLLREM